jgi:hypothetical protein
MNIEHRMLRVSLGVVVMTPQDPAISGIPIDFILFGLTLPGVAEFHQHILRLALAGLVTVVFCLLLGFTVLSGHFKKSRVPLVLPKYLPRERKGGFVLLGMLSGESARWLCPGDCCGVQRWRRVERTG